MWDRTGIKMMEQLEIYLIRHGKTQGNLEKRYIGCTDEKLCEEGKADLRARTYPKVDIIFSSPMRRCKETLQLIYGDQPYQLIPEFQEINFGDFEGKNYQDLSENPDYQSWIDSGGVIAFPNGESREDFKYRCLLGFQKMCEQSIHMAEERGFALSSQKLKIGAVVHGGTIMSLCSEIKGGDYFSYQVDNGDYIKL